MRPVFMRLIAVIFIFITTFISLLQSSFNAFAWIYFPSLTIYEAIVIYSFIREKRLKKDM